MSADAGTTGTPATGTPAAPEEGAAPEAKTFTQDDINRIVGEAKRSERLKFADYDTLKAAAAGARSVEQQLQDLQKQNASMARDVLAAKIASKHKISSEDADLFLTGADEDTLNAQAARLAAHLKAEAKEESSTGSRRGTVYAPLEGRNPKNSGVSEERRAVRALFGGGTAE